jgi:alpha-D-ribose 1-methylphosphonate 5-triphosphate synthase subunit PhnG
LYRLQTTLEIELSATRAKLHKSELKVGGLEGTVEAKSRENSELMAICDELIQKIDSQAAVAGTSRSANILASLNLNRISNQ